MWAQKCSPTAVETVLSLFQVLTVQVLAGQMKVPEAPTLTYPTSTNVGKGHLASFGLR
jgi:hypothetical protein